MQLFIFSLLLLGVSLGLASPPGPSEAKLERSGCPMFWYGFNGRCYKYVATQMPWADAELHCVSQNANLVSIHSLEENNFVKTLIQNYDHAHAPTWIGLHDALKDRGWMWSDGSRVSFTKWNKGEPNGGGSEQCVLINYGGGKQWNDSRCPNAHPSVCVKRTTCS